MKTKLIFTVLALGLVIAFSAATGSQAMSDNLSVEPVTLLTGVLEQNTSGKTMKANELNNQTPGCGQLTPLWEPDDPAALAQAQNLESPQELTVLTYNTHLWGGSQVCGFVPSLCYRDIKRARAIVDKIKESGADIVGLQEIWEQPPYEGPVGLWHHWQEGFIDELSQNYPYAWYHNGCSSQPLMVGSGLVLLSKWPLEDLSYRKFPVYDYQTEINDSDFFAAKGVIAATAQVGNPPKPIRVGISHALTGQDDQKSKWDDAYVATAITPFSLNGETYFFSLKSDSNTAFLTQIEDYSYYDKDIGVMRYGAGYEDLIEAGWSSNYVAVESFELNGHPWLFGLKDYWDEAYFTRINDDPSTGWTDIKVVDWDSSYKGTTITSFELNGKPYIFGLKTTWDQAWFSRINADPQTGNIDIANPYTDFGPYTWDRDYLAIDSFELDGQPWLFGLKSNWDQAWFSKINADPITGDINPLNPFTDYGPYSWDRHYKAGSITSFQMNGQPYIFGIKTTWDQAWISRIRFNEETQQIEFDDFMFPWNNDYVAVESFELNGMPYLFALKDCCSQYINLCAESRPGELFLTRIYEEDGIVKIEDVNQLEDMRIIRDATVRDDMPAIMMGDFNIHRSKYGWMDAIFAQVGAIDAYIAVHGTGEGGETIDDANNLLAQIFPNGDPNCPGTENCFDRIDYVYVQETPANAPPNASPDVEAGPDQTVVEGDPVSLDSATFQDTPGAVSLIPTDAYVIRDWKFFDASIPPFIFTDDYMDLSDHYPLVVTFEIQQQVDSHTATIDWGDGIQDAGAISLQDSSISGSHVYADDGTYTVEVCVTDSQGGMGCDTLKIVVENAAPTVETIPDQSVDEGSALNLMAAFNDKGTLDTHLAVIDWGVLSTLEDGLVSETPFGPPGSTLGADGTVSGSYIYGDDGLFTLSITVTDDDNDSGSVFFDLTVNNVNPNAQIDLSDAVLINNLPTFLAHAGETLNFDGRAIDPGSDDLYLGWDWGDDFPVMTIEDLVHPPNPDPFPSPDLTPRDVMDSRTHTFSDACLYEISFLVDDDDGGHGEDHAIVVITANANKARSEGYWQNQYSRKGKIDFDQTTLECYLAIVENVSTVFGEDRDITTIEQAYDVLFLKNNQGSEREQLDRELLTVWLNFANGTIDYLELLDTDKDGIGDTSFGDVLSAAETVRLDTGATDKEIKEQTNILHHITQMSD